jgi:uncharacterized protein YceK
MKALLLFMAVLCFLSCGCYKVVLHEEKGTPGDPNNRGSATKLEMRGPRARIKHEF